MARGSRSAPLVWSTGLGRSARQDTGGGLQEGPRPQMRLGVFCIRWGHWQVFFSLRSRLI